MPTIVSTTLAFQSESAVLATTVINWAPNELGINYILRYNFWEQDPKKDDRLNYGVDRVLAAPHPATQTDTVLISSHPSWDNEVGEDEIYARVELFPDPRTGPGTTTGRTNVVARRW